MITATVSHEMRTPINAILMMIETLMTIEEDPEKKRMYQVLRTSAQLLLYLVNDMLDVFLLKTGKFEKITDRFQLK